MSATPEDTDVLARGVDGTLAIVHEWVAARAGSEKVFEAMAQTFPEADLYALTREPSVALDIGDREVTTTFLDRHRLRSRRAVTLPLMPLAWRRIHVRRAYDRVITSSHACARAFPPARAAVHYCYCHSPMRYAWTPDLDRRSSRVAALASAGTPVLRQWDRRSAATVDHFAANSTDVQARIRRFYGRDARVIFPPVDTAFYTPDPATTRGPFVLAASRFIQYKRLDLAIGAAARAAMPIVVVGTGPEEAALRRLAAETGADATFVIAPSDVTLRDLYRRAFALVYPGHEDFGLIPVEAQACGTPVIGLDAGGIRDTVIDGVSGIRVATQDVGSFAGALRDAQTRGFDAGDCRRNALRFSRERFVDALHAWVTDGGGGHEHRRP